MTRLSRRQFGQWTALAFGAVSLGGCAPWEQADPQHGLDRLTSEPAPTPLEWRVLNRLGYGPRPGDLSRLRAQGIDVWIEGQLHPESIVESADLEAALARLDTLNLSPEEARDREMDWEPETAVSPVVQRMLKVGKRRDAAPGLARQELVQATVLRAAFSERTLQEVMVEFWSDHFSINQAKGDCRWLKTIDDREMRPHALGHFRELLGASAHSPAMLFNLDNSENRKPRDPLDPHFNENYARELLELHTLGDTTTYSQHDIQDVARVLSGWTIGEAGSASEGQFVFRAADHDDGEKIVLGQRIPAGQGQRDGDQLLDLLAGHPLTARHVSGKLCSRFLGSVSTQMRDRLAAVFLRTQGDIRQVVAELVQSEEFRSVPADTATPASFATGDGGQPLFKRPFQFAISAMRMLGARTSGADIIPYLESMGQRPFAWIQPNGYPLRSDFWSAGLLSRWSFAIDLVRNKIGETWINLGALQRATDGKSPADVCRRLSRGLLATPLGASEVDALAGLNSDTAGALPQDGLSQCLALLLMSPQFQWC
jgi:uncharacterized protein (DUF1800 family)